MKKFEPNAYPMLLPGAEPVVQSPQPPPTGDAADHVTGIELALRAAHAAEDFLQRGDLRLRQAAYPNRRPLHSSAAGLNWQRSGLSMTPSFTPSLASQDWSAAASMAGSFDWRNVRRRVGHRLRDPDAVGEEVRPVVGGRAGDDAVVVGGEALRLHERLAAAVRAGIEVRALGRAAVERRDGRFRCDGGFVDRAIAEVDDLLGMAERPAGIGAAGAVAGVGGGRGVAARDGARQRRHS